MFSTPARPTEVAYHIGRESVAEILTKKRETKDERPAAAFGELNTSGWLCQEDQFVSISREYPNWSRAAGERLHQEFQWEVGGRVARLGALLYVAGGACAAGALQADLQPDQTAQISGLPAAGD